MRTLVDNLRNKLGSGVVVLGSVAGWQGGADRRRDQRSDFARAGGQDRCEIAKHVGGSGGGRPDMAEAGGKDPAGLDAALNSSYEVVEGLLP